MSKRTSYLLALVLLCGVGQAGVSTADGAEFIGRLPHGTVELVGIANYPPTRQSRWWQPDGSDAQEQPDGSAARLGSFLPQRARLRVPGDWKAFTFFVRFKNLPDNASRAVWRTDPSPFQSYEPIAGSPLWEFVDVVDAPGAFTASSADSSRPTAQTQAGDYARGNIVPDCKMLSALFETSAQTTNLRFGVGMGVWETVITQKPDKAGRRMFSRDGEQWAVTFQKATTGMTTDIHHKAAVGTPAHTTQVKLTHTLPYGKCDRRLVAVASDGSEHAPSIDDGYKWKSGRAVFQDLPLPSIKEFRFQVRPYYWVEFKNVSLQSGQKTNATVVSSDDSVNPEK